MATYDDDHDDDHDTKTGPSADELHNSVYGSGIEHPLGDMETKAYTARDLRAQEEKQMGITPGNLPDLRTDEGPRGSGAPDLAAQGRDDRRRDAKTAKTAQGIPSTDLRDAEEGGNRRPKVDWLNGGFYKGKAGDQQPAGGAKSFYSRHKKAVIFGSLLSAGAVFFVGILLIIVLLLAPFKNVHFATVLRSVGMARFTYVMNKQFSRTIFDAAVLTDNSTGRFVPPKDSLFYKVLGITPQKNLLELGNQNKLKFDFTGESRFGDKTGGLLGRTNTFNGVVIDGKGYYLNDYAKRMYGVNFDDLSTVSLTGRTEQTRVLSAFANDVQSKLSDMLQLKTRRFRWGVYKGFYQATGIKLIKWYNRGKDYSNLNDAEARAKNVDDTIKQVEGEDAKARSTGVSEIDNEAQQERTDTINATKTGDTPGQVRSKLANRLRTASDVSTAFAAVTMACVLHGLANAFDGSQQMREQNVARFGAEIQTAADQQKYGDTTAQAVGAENAMWTDAQKSAGYKSATGRALSSDDQKELAGVPSVLPPNQKFADIISLVDKVMTGGFITGFIPGLNQVHDYLANVGCDAVLNPYSQALISGGEIALAVYSAGSTEGIVAAIRAAISSGLQLGGSVGLGELLGLFVDNVIHSVANLDFSGIQTGSARFDQGLVATDYMQQVGNRQITFGAPMSVDDANAAQQQAMADLHAQNAQQSFTERYFAMDNPFSLSSNVAAVMPTTFSGMADSIRGGIMSTLSVISSPQRLFGSIASVFTSHNHAFAAATIKRSDSFGVDEWGWTTDELSKVDNDPSFDLTQLIQTVEPNLATLNTKYGPCYDSGYVLQTNKPSQCTRGFLASDEALHWRSYMAQTYAATHLTGSI